MIETEEKTKKPFIGINPDREERKSALPCFLAAAVLMCGMYLTELFHLLEKPLFSLFFYGTANDIFFAGCSVVYMLVFFFFFHRFVSKRLGSPFKKHEDKIGLKRSVALYLMTLLPVLIVGAALNFQFKLVFELGERFSGVTLMCKMAMYVFSAVKLLFAVYFIFLAEQGFRRIFTGGKIIPFGGLALTAVFGVIEFFLSSSALNWLYLILCLYYGIIWLVSGERFAVTYSLSVILFIL